MSFTILSAKNLTHQRFSDWMIRWYHDHCCYLWLQSLFIIDDVVVVVIISIIVVQSSLSLIITIMMFFCCHLYHPLSYALLSSLPYHTAVIITMFSIIMIFIAVIVTIIVIIVHPHVHFCCDFLVLALLSSRFIIVFYCCYFAHVPQKSTYIYIYTHQKWCVGKCISGFKHCVIFGYLAVEFRGCISHENQAFIHSFSETTVDGWNPAPVDMVNFPLFTGFCTSQVVQDFFHQQ